MNVRKARDLFLSENGFDLADYEAKTVAIPIGPLTVKLPNTAGRKEVVRWHDLHHLATGYGTDFAGEAEIGAFELRAGCTTLASYLYNGLAVACGLVIAPVRTVRAFLRGAGKRTLYRLGLSYDQALALNIKELREHMGLAS